MKSIAAVALLAALTVAPSALFAQGTAAPAPAVAGAAKGYSIEDTDVGTLLDDPAAKAILDKYVPGMSTNPQIDMGRSLTLKTMQQYAPDMLSDVQLANIQNDLNKLPKKK